MPDLRDLVLDLRERLAIARTGGSQASRERHVSRGKLLVRDRVDRLLDPGSPFLELSPLAATGMYDGRRAERRDRHRHRQGQRPRVRDRRQRRHREGRHLLPDDREEAPAGAGDRAGQPAALPLPRRLRRRLPAACRTRCSRTGTTSAGSSSTRPTCRQRASRSSPAVMGSCTAGGAYVPAMSRRDGDRAQPGHDLPRRAAAGEGGHRRGRHAPRSSAAATCTRASPGVVDHLATDDAHALAIAAIDRRHAGASARAVARRSGQLDEPAEDPPSLYDVVPPTPARRTTCAR